jgi:hypothetical protein
MTHFLVTAENPKGHKLEDILAMIRKDILTRTLKIADDPRAEARRVMQNNMKILGLISEAIVLAEDSTHVLTKSFGPSKDGQSRIGYP